MGKITHATVNSMEEVENTSVVNKLSVGLGAIQGNLSATEHAGSIL